MASIDNLYEEELFIKFVNFSKKGKVSDFKYIMFSILSLGLIPLICWKDNQYLQRWFFEIVDDEKEASHVYIENKDNSFNLCRLIPVEHPFTGSQTLKFIHKHLHYYQEEEGIRQFRYFAFPFTRFSTSDLGKLKNGLTSSKASSLIAKFNDSQILVPKIGLLEFMVRELTNFFFLFQVFGIILWFLENFWMYSVGVIVATFTFTTMNYLLITHSHKKLLKLAECHTTVKVIRDGAWTEVSGNGLVPGDIVDLPASSIIPCDCLLLSGEMLVNESMLTGESVPQSKSAYTKEGQLALDKNSGSFLFGGTIILQKRTINGEQTLALVTRTAFASEKGNLIRDILFPAPISFDFYKSGFKTLALLGVFILILFIPMMVNYSKFDNDWLFYVFISFDTLLWLMPPDLPIYITTAKAFSLVRLNYKGIIGLFPDKIMVAGEITTCFFDKTGTITESDLNLKGVIMASNMSLMSTSQCGNDVKSGNKLFHAMACCHSICINNGELMGDSMEIQMFKHSGWNYKQVSSEGVEIFDSYSIQSESLRPLKTYEFSSDLQMMSSVVEDIHFVKFIYSKGAPEMLITKMDPRSVPDNYMNVVEGMAIQGYRVLAIAYKKLDSWDSKEVREAYEENLEFLGFLVFENKLKEDSSASLATLANAKLKVRVISGDNPLTTISVAYQANILPKGPPLVIIDEIEGNLVSKQQAFPSPGVSNVDIESLVQERILISGQAGIESLNLRDMIPEKDFNSVEIAVTGKAIKFFTSRNLDLPAFILNKARVYARVKPDQKAYVVKRVRAQGEVVCMCGDGSNDCSAIKAADIGVSFTDNEASLTAPFSSVKPSISAVELILLEGRCTMQVAIDVFKIDVLSNVLKFMAIFLLSFNGTFLGDSGWLWVTFINGVPIMVLIGASPPFYQLVERKPDANMFSLRNVLSLFGQFAIYSIPLIIVYVSVNEIYLVPQGPDFSMEGYDVTALLYILGFEIVLMAITFYKGNPFKRYIFYNIALSIVIFILFVINSVVIVQEETAFDDFLVIYPLEMEDKSFIYGICWVFFIIAFLYEQVLLSLLPYKKSSVD